MCYIADTSTNEQYKLPRADHPTPVLLHETLHSLPGEDQVCHLEAVPRGVLQEPVAAGAVVHEDHHHDRKAEDIEQNFIWSIIYMGEP